MLMPLALLRHAFVDIYATRYFTLPLRPAADAISTRHIFALLFHAFMPPLMSTFTPFTTTSPFATLAI